MQHSRLTNRWSALLISAIMLAALVVAACSPVTKQAAQSAAPAAMAAPDVAADWSRIQEAGAIVVGTEPSYPPFEYYDDTFQVDGFDAALMRAIGEQLGVTVEFKDIAFDGIPGSLALGQIDVAIAAITQTPARAAKVDFTTPYFATTEGYLVRPNAEVKAVSKAEDLANVRIGAQRGTVFETWLRAQLVDTGIMSADKLLLYTSDQLAVADLLEERIDVVVTDLPAAQALAKSGAVKVAGSGLFDEQYALALRKGSSELVARINAALDVLQQNGTVARLAKQYLELEPDQLLPIDKTPLEATGKPEPPACIDGLAFVEDLTFGDQNMTAPPVMIPGQPFTKSWRVQNIGTCPWDSSYQLAFTSGSAPGAAMGGEAVAIQGQVAPGDTYDISVDLVTPLTAGVIQGVWQLQNREGASFGESLHVGLQVAGSPTPTPAPTQTPVPGISFSADAERVLQGSPVRLSWAVEGADAVYFAKAGQALKNREVDPVGSATDFPAATTIYNLRVVWPDGTEMLREVTVYVEPSPDLPQFSYFTVAPDSSIPAGSCVTLAWGIEGDADQVTIFRGQETLWDAAPLEGTWEDCPAEPGFYDYAVGAAKGGRFNYAVQTVKVTAAAPAAAAESVSRATPAGPVIDVFAVQPEAIDVNACVTINWTVGSDAKTIRILRDDVVLLDGAPNSGSGSDCLTAAGVYRYRLEATNDSGAQSTAEAAVTSGEVTPTPVAEAVAVQPSELNGKRFILTGYRDLAGAQVPPLAGSQITIKFSDDGRLSGSAGCNNYSGSFMASDGALTLPPIAATRKFCAEPLGVMAQEAQYLSVLQTAGAYQLDGSQLTLLDGAGNVVAAYVASE
ncbi:MAG: transporter substrate-binding domain-containing protein [Anaerolineales bacterium]|nr:transporter substrate-binding domain-containing protein [Anaerolineales bacterium]